MHWYPLLYDDCSIRVYRLFTTSFHKCLILLLIFVLHFTIMLALRLMLSITQYAQNYVIDWSLYILLKLPSHSFHYCYS